MFRSIITVVLLTVACLFLFGGILNAGTLSDGQNGYSFEYPFNWTGKTFPGSHDLVKGEMVRDNKTGSQVRVYPNNGSADDFYEWYVTDFMKQMEGHWGGKMYVLNKEYLNIGGVPCFVVTFDFTRRDTSRWFFKQYLWPRRGNMLVLQAGTPYEHRQLDEPAFDSIAGSIELR